MQKQKKRIKNRLEPYVNPIKTLLKPYENPIKTLSTSIKTLTKFGPERIGLAAGARDVLVSLARNKRGTGAKTAPGRRQNVPGQEASGPPGIDSGVPPGGGAPK